MKLRKVLPFVAVAVVLMMLPGTALAANDTVTVQKRFEDAPAVGTTYDLGYGDVTGLTCVGDNPQDGDVIFDVHFDDTNGFFGEEIEVGQLYCMDKDLGALGGGYGEQPWPIAWVGGPTRFKATAQVVGVNKNNCTVTYRVIAYHVRNEGAGEITDPRVTGFQRMEGEFVVRYTPGGYAELLKVSAAPSCTDGNPMYSLEGATYGLYATEDDALADENRLFTFTTAADGSTNRTDWIAGGNYYVKELSASRGYKLDETTHSVTVVGGVNTFTMEEKPYSDPPAIWKVDENLVFDPYVYFDGSANEAAGGATLAGALFSVKYYAGTYTQAECAALTPTRSWVVKTLATGHAYVDAEHFVSGDAFYYNEGGDETMPLGTVIITEIQAPTGYLLPDPVPDVLVTITATGPVYSTGYTAVFAKDPVIQGRIKVTKTLLDETGAPADPAKLEGIRVLVVSQTTNQTVATLTLDETGSATSGLLPYDTYSLFEDPASLPADVQPYAWTTAGTTDALSFGSVSITEQKTYTAEFSDYAARNITVTKVDKDTKDPLAGVGFSLYKVPASFITVTDGVVTVAPEFTEADWEYVSAGTTNTSGVVVFANLQFGAYRVIETGPLNGYLADITPHDFTFDKSSQSAGFTMENKSVSINVQVVERTNDFTSAAYDGTPYGLPNHVGQEEYLYHIGTANLSNVATDAFDLTTDLTALTTMGLRVTHLWTADATGDADGQANLFFRTNDIAAWTLWTDLDLADPRQLDVAALGLADGDYLTGLKVEFGQVAADFHSGTTYGDTFDWCFSVMATRALNPGDGRIANTTTAETSLTVGPNTVLAARDTAGVVTDTVTGFAVAGSSDFAAFGTWTLPPTADKNGRYLVVFLVEIFLALSLILTALQLRKNAKETATDAERRRNVRSATGALACAAVCVVMCVALFFTDRGTALAAQFDAADGVRDGQEQVLTCTFTFMAGEEAPAIPETFTKDGVEYTLSDVTNPAVDSTFTPSMRTFTHTETVTIESTNPEDNPLPALWPIEESGFAGDIPCVSVEHEAQVTNAVGVVERTATYGPFATNDPSLVPKELRVDVPDAEGSHPEVLGAVNWTWTSGVNPLGMAAGYSCTALYRGTVAYTQTTGQTITAHYEGSLPAPEQRMVITATYKARAAAAVAAPFRLPTGVKAGAGAAAAALAAGALVFFRRRNVAICRPDDEKVLARVHASRTAEALRVPIPARISLEDGVVLFLRENLCDGGPLQVVQAGVTVFTGFAESRVSLKPPAAADTPCADASAPGEDTPVEAAAPVPALKEKQTAVA